MHTASSVALPDRPIALAMGSRTTEAIASPTGPNRTPLDSATMRSAR